MKDITVHTELERLVATVPWNIEMIAVCHKGLMWSIVQDKLE